MEDSKSNLCSSGWRIPLLSIARLLYLVVSPALVMRHGDLIYISAWQ
jgi:hypothetical protein